MPFGVRLPIFYPLPATLSDVTRPPANPGTVAYIRFITVIS